MARQRIAVIGGVASGPAAAAQAVRSDPEADVVLFEQDAHISYGACEMPYYIAGWIEDYHRLVVLTPAEFERTRGAKVHVRHRVTSIEPEKNRLRVRDLSAGTEREEQFDTFILAMGARARMPEIDGLDAENVFPMRRLDDAIKLRGYLDTHEVRHAVVLGAGYVGIEVAEALAARDIRVSILEPAGRPLPAYLDDEFSGLIVDELKSNGVLIRPDRGAVLGRDSDGRVDAVVTDVGERIGCQLVVVAIGTTPNTELAEEAGAKVGGTGALATNDEMRTNLENVWACGDLAEVRRIVDGARVHVPLSPAAFRTARVAAQNAARGGDGTQATFPGVSPASAVKVFELEVAAAGLRLEEAMAAGFDAVSSSVKHWSRVKIYPGSKPIHVRTVVERGSGRLLGAEVIGKEGAAQRLNVLVPLIRDGWTVKAIRDLDVIYTPPFAPSLDPLVVAANEAWKKASAAGRR